MSEKIPLDTSLQNHGLELRGPVPAIEQIERNFIESGAAAQQLFSTFDVGDVDAAMQAAAEDRKQQLDLFLAGDIRYPRLSNCPRFDVDHDEREAIKYDLETISFDLVRRHQAGVDTTPGDAVMRALVDMGQAENWAVEAASTLDRGTLQPAARQKQAATLKTDLRDAYGMPDPDRALNLLAGRLLLARAAAEDRDHPLQTVGTEVLELVSMPDVNYEKPQPMSPQAIQHYKNIITDEYKDALAYAFEASGSKDEYSPEDTLGITTRFLQHCGFADAGFTAQLVPNRTSSLASMPDSAFLLGADRSAAMRTYDKLVDTLLHEGGYHIRRMARARMAGMRLAGYALDRANVFEEPLAVTGIDNYNGTSNVHGEAYTIPIALSAGYDGGADRDFPDTHEALWRLGLLKTFTADKPLDDQVTAARKAAARNMVRNWRGMPTDVPGCIMPRDHAYDNVAVQRYLQPDGRVLSREEYLALLDARYDPTQSHHLAYVDQFRH